MRERLFVVALVSCLAGCGSWAGNPRDPKPTPPAEPKTASEVVLEVRGRRAGAQLAGATTIRVTGTAGTPIGTIALESARIVLRDVRLAQTGAMAQRASFEGPFVADLLGERLDPEPPAIVLDAGTYAELSFKVQKLEDGEGGIGKDDPLAKRSIHFAGSFIPVEGEARPLVFRHEFDEEVRVRPATAGGIAISAERRNTLVVDFDLDRWFDFTGKERDLLGVTGSSIVLDAESGEVEKKLREDVKENVKASGEFRGKDD